jgi:hypothetical protein
MSVVRLYLLVIVVGCSLALAGWVAKSWMEARTFERLTGKKVSVVDAMFVELRVQETIR